MLKYFAFRAGAAILGRLPLGFAYALATPAAFAAYRLNGRARNAVRDNMRHVLGVGASEREIDAAARAVFRMSMKYYVDLLKFGGLSQEFIRADRVILKGMERLTAALQEGRGVLAVSAHFGNPELVAQALPANVASVLALTEPLEPPALSRFLDARRSALGHRFRAADYNGLKEAMRTLRSGGIVAILFDRDIQGRSTVIDLCGAPAAVPVGAAEFAIRTNAVVLPVFSERRIDNRLRVHIESPLDVIRTGDREADTIAAIRAMFDRFEPRLRADPTQWMVLEQVWDTPPPQSAPSS